MMHLVSGFSPAPFSPEKERKPLPSTFGDTPLKAKSPNRSVNETASTPIAQCPIDRHPSRYCSDESCRIRYRAEHAALHLDHFYRVIVVALIGRATAIFEQQTLETAIIGFTHGRMHADIGGDAGEHQIFDPAQAQQQLEIGSTEGALAGLVDHRLAVARREIRNDVPPRLAANENAAAGALVADAGADAARAPAFVGWKIGEIGAVPFA